jgi:septation ring formation regulator EzrA
MSNLLSLFNKPNFCDLEKELESANAKLEILEKKLEDFNKRLTDIEEDFKKNNKEIRQEIREEQVKSKKRIIDIYKYYKSTTTFGTISLNNALDMIYKRFLNYTFTEQDSQKNIIHLDYEELPERVALREREKNIFG